MSTRAREDVLADNAHSKVRDDMQPSTLKDSHRQDVLVPDATVLGMQPRLIPVALTQLTGINWRQDPCSVNIDTLSNGGMTTKLRIKDYDIVAEQMGPLFPEFEEDNQYYAGSPRPARSRGPKQNRS